MFKHIVAPVDLLHLDSLERALSVTAEMARLLGAKVTFVSVTIAGPSRIASGPDDFRAKLQHLVDGLNVKYGMSAAAHPVFSNDPTVDVDDALLRTVEELGADLVIMASHKPGFADYFWPSNGGRIASHSDVSVFLVRDETT